MQLFPFSGVCVCARAAARNRLIIGNATGDSRFFLTSVLVPSVVLSLSMYLSLLSFLLDLSLAVVGLLLVSEVGGERDRV
jgi:hypothetical protein